MGARTELIRVTVHAPGDEEQRDKLPVWVIAGPLAQVRGIAWLEREKLGAWLVRPGRGICEGDIGQAVFEAVGRYRVRRKQGGVDMIEDEGVETLERDIHCGRRRGGDRKSVV